MLLQEKLKLCTPLINGNVAVYRMNQSKVIIISLPSMKLFSITPNKGQLFLSPHLPICFIWMLKPWSTESSQSMHDVWLVERFFLNITYTLEQGHHQQMWNRAPQWHHREYGIPPIFKTTNIQKRLPRDLWQILKKLQEDLTKYWLLIACNLLYSSRVWVIGWGG